MDVAPWWKGTLGCHIHVVGNPASRPDPRRWEPSKPPEAGRAVRNGAAPEVVGQAGTLTAKAKPEPSPLKESRDVADLFGWPAVRARAGDRQLPDRRAGAQAADARVPPPGAGHLRPPDRGRHH